MAVALNIETVLNKYRLLVGNELRRFHMVTSPRGVSISPDGLMAASGSLRGFVYLWRLPPFPASVGMEQNVFKAWIDLFKEGNKEKSPGG